jgi:hypothetical protein
MDRENIEQLVLYYRLWRAKWLKMTPDIAKQLDAYVYESVLSCNTTEEVISTFFSRSKFQTKFDKLMGHYYAYKDPTYIDRDVPATPLKGHVVFFDKVDELEKLKTIMPEYKSSFIYPFVFIQPIDMSKPVDFRLISPLENLEKDEDIHYCRKLREYYNMSIYKHKMKFADTTPLLDRGMKRCMLSINKDISLYTIIRNLI